jgi:hypothetical protein
MLALGCAGIISYFLKSSEVFPSASIDLRISRSQVLAITKDWANTVGYKSDGAIESTVFSYDDDAKTFLEHELGLQEANALMKDKIPIWYWSSRLCRPLNLEEFSTAINPLGKVVSFEHAIENELSLPSIAHADARALGKEFVETEIGLSLSGYKLIEDGSLAQPHRTDHYFTWENQQEDFKGARLRTYIYVAGNKVSAFNHFLYIPETWLRKFSEMRSYNKVLEEIASIFYAIFNVATFFAFVWMFTKGAIRWRFALTMAAVVAVVEYLESLNSMPNSVRNYTTTMSYHGYVLDIYISALWSSLGQALQTLILVGASEALYRMAYPAKVALETTITATGLRSKQVITGLIAGHAMFGIHLGWIIYYYLLGQPLHFWSPLEVRNVESLSTVFPFFSAIYIGLSAALSEELTYRVLGMSIFARLTKHFWLSNLLQAAAWAFMHSNYPQEPAYARGLELTAVGLLYGFILRKYGLLPCIVSHFVFDAFLSVNPLMSSTILSLKLSSLIAYCPFLAALAAGAWLVKTRGWAAEDEHFNSKIPIAQVSEAVEEIFPQSPYQYERLSGSWRKALCIAAISAALLEFGYFFPVVEQDAKLTISRQEAIERARHELINKKIPPETRMDAAWLTRGKSSQELQQLQYLFEKVKFAKTNELASSPGFPLVWQVRFFKPLDPEEYLVVLDSLGRALSMSVTKPENSSGARLSQDEARRKTEEYLATEHPELKPLEFDSIRSHEHKARTDYRVTFKSPKYNVPGADFKVTVRLVGDSISDFDQDWDLPDKWLFERSRQTNKDQVASYVVATAGLIVLLSIIWWIVGVARSGAIRWRAPIIFGLMMALLVIPETINDLPELYVGYGTDTPLLSYFVAQGVKQIMTAVQMIAMVVGLGAFSLASFRLLFPRTTVPAVLRSGLGGEAGNSILVQRDFWLDAILAGYAAGLGSRALQVVYSAVHAKISPVVTLAPLDGFCTFANVLSPAANTIMDAFTRGIQSVLLAGVMAGIYAKYFKSVRGYLLFSLAASLIYPSTDRYWQDYLIDVVNYLLFFVCTWTLIKRAGKQNLLAYFLAGASAMIAGDLRVLAAHGPTFFQHDIVILTLVLASPLVYLLYLYSQPADSVAADTAGAGGSSPPA